MIAYVQTSVVDSGPVVTTIFFDKGGLKSVSKNGEFDVSWAKTLKEVQEGDQNSMYRGGMFVDLDKNEFHNLIGMDSEEFYTKYGNRAISI